MSDKVRCDNCGGKGHVVFGMGVVVCILCPPFWLMPFLEKSDPRGFTRQPCEVCNGTGFRKCEATR
jgi:hypothetical protein